LLSNIADIVGGYNGGSTDTRFLALCTHHFQLHLPPFYYEPPNLWNAMQTLSYLQNAMQTLTYIYRTPCKRLPIITKCDLQNARSQKTTHIFLKALETNWNFFLSATVGFTQQYGTDFDVAFCPVIR